MIEVSETGLYSVDVFGYCVTTRDSITINLEETPKAFSLGDDSELCVFVPKVLQPTNDSNGLTFLWQDGSSSSTFEAKEYGKYWVIIKNFCGAQSDSITYSKSNLQLGFVPNVITPNGDLDNEFFILDESVVGMVSLKVINRWGKEVY